MADRIPRLLTEHRNPPGGLSASIGSIPIEFVFEHRFAFCSWVNRRHDHLLSSSDPPPNLITWDSQDDVGLVTSDLQIELDELSLSNPQEIALFAWTGLPDGHISHACWLDVVGDVYALTHTESTDRVQIDRFGQPHQIRYYQSSHELAAAIPKHPLVWDIDMDYFAKADIDDVRDILRPDQPWMRPIMENLEAMTIALTVDLPMSLQIYTALEESLVRAVR